MNTSILLFAGNNSQPNKIFFHISVSFQRKKKSGKKKNKQKPMNGFNFPEMPMPDLAQLRNVSKLFYI